MKRETIVKKFERRFIVRKIDPDIQRAPSMRIEQGYFEGTDMRVRITDGKLAELTRKSGRSRDRTERNFSIDVATAQFLLDTLRHRLSKRRYKRGGWEVDYFQGPLSGLVVAEYDMASPDEEVTLPPWMHDAVEVTHSLTNAHLARMAYDLHGENPDRPIRDLLPRQLPRIVLTGGPCSGKSTVMKALRTEFKDAIHCVPETATIVIEQVGVRPPVNDPLAMKTFQRTLYRVQTGFEEISNRQALADGKLALVMDRGTVDGAAYMMRGVADLETACGTTVKDEYARYRGVVCLEVPPKDAYDAKKANNAAQSENHVQAMKLGERIATAWGGHPKRILVPNGTSWDEKLAAARAAVLRLIKDDTTKDET